MADTERERLERIVLEKRVEEKRALKAQEDAKSLPSTMQNVGDTLEGFSKSMTEAIPFSQIPKKAAAALQAAIPSSLSGYEPGTTFAQRYEKEKALQAQELAQAQAKAPIASAIGSAYGAIGGSGALPIVGMQGSGVLPAVSRVAGVVGETGLEALSRGEDIKAPTTMSGTIQTGLELAIPGAKKFLGPAAKTLGGLAKGGAEKLTQFAQESATKATLGRQLSQYKDLMKKKEIRAFGQRVLDNKLIGPLSTAKSIYDKASKKAQNAWADVEGVLTKVDELQGKYPIQNPGVVDGDDISMFLLAKAESQPIGTPGMERAAELKKQAEVFAGKRFTLDEAQKSKRSYVYDKMNPRALDEDGYSIVNHALAQAMDNAVANSPIEESLKKLYVKKKKEFGTFADIRDKSLPEASKLFSNDWNSLTNAVLTGAGATGLAGLAASTDDPTALAAIPGLVVAGRLARTGGRSFIAATAPKAANFLKNAPDKLGKYAQILENAAKRGNIAFAATHALLMQKDPKYQELLVDQNPEKLPESLKPMDNSGKYSPLFKQAKERGGDKAVVAQHFQLMQSDPEYRKKLLNKQ